MPTFTSVTAALLMAAGFTDPMWFLARTNPKPVVEAMAFVSPNGEKLGAKTEPLRAQAQAALEGCGLHPRQGPAAPANVVAIVSVAGVQVKDGWWAATVNLSLQTTIPAEGTRVAINLFTDENMVAGAPGTAPAKITEELAILLKGACAAWADGRSRVPSPPAGK